jgi:4-amino-4-deoxy-L-arabinose transferase-like glycosyltransferase
VLDTAPRPVRPSPRQAPPAPVTRRRRVTAPPELLVVLGAAVLAGVTMLWNIARSPDTQYDEVVYTKAAQQVAGNWSLTWTNQPMFVHPPLSFLAQAGWIRLLGLQDAPLEEAIVAARVLTAAAMIFAFLLVGLLAANLASRAGRRRGLVVVAVVVAVAATDPVLLRYGRLAMIEPLALIAALLTLCLAIWLRGRRALVYVPVVGMATGLTLLTKEVSAFLVFTPVVHQLLGRDLRRAACTFAGFLWGLGLWLLFPLWAATLGLTSSFTSQKFSMFERLTGLLQITGWNRPGVSFLGAIGSSAGQYATSYLVMVGGGAALVWLLFSSTTGPARWLLAWLLTSYGFAAYSVVLGTLNEQFFVYLMPASIAGTVLMADAVVTARVRAARARGRTSRPPRAAVAAGAGLTLLLGIATASWARYYVPANDGIFATAAYVRSEVPACSVITTTAEAARFTHLLPGRAVGSFATVGGALSHGVHLFVVSDKDVLGGAVTADFPAAVRSRGRLLASFASATYHGIQLWEVPADPYDPFADVETVPGGDFVTTVGSRCGGFPVLDGRDGAFSEGWDALGGKAVAGAPLTVSFPAGGGARQLFRGALLASDGTDGVRAAPIVAALAAARPDAWRQAQLPPVGRPAAGAGTTDADVLALLTDPAIAAAYLQAPEGGPAPAGATARARARLGDPLGPATTMPDGAVRQAFAGGVLERPAAGGGARLAPIGQLALDAGLVAPPPAARAPAATPPLPVSPDEQLGRDEPTSVKPFVESLLAGLALYVGLPTAVHELVALRRRRRRGAS